MSKGLVGHRAKGFTLNTIMTVISKRAGHQNKNTFLQITKDKKKIFCGHYFPSEATICSDFRHSLKFRSVNVRGETIYRRKKN